MLRACALGFHAIIALPLASCAPGGGGGVGNTEITRWQDGKSGAISITFDDGRRIAVQGHEFGSHTIPFVMYRATPNTEPVELSRGGS